MTLGVVFPPALGVEELTGFARAAEEAGVDELWLWEDCFADGGVVAAATALAVTSTISVATGILPVPLRSAVVLAMEAAALARLHPGRFALGIGHGVQDWMGQAGVRADAPLALLREHAAALRDLLAGKTVDVAGRYVSLDGVRLERPPSVVPPLWIAGEGPRTLEAAGELGDGVLLTAGTSPGRAADAVARAAEGRRRSGRPGPVPVAAYIFTAFAESSTAIAAGRAALSEQGERWGLGDGMRDGIVGDAAEVARRVEEWRAAGVSRPVLVPLDGADRSAFVRGAGEVARLLRLS